MRRRNIFVVGLAAALLPGGATSQVTAPAPARGGAGSGTATVRGVVQLEGAAPSGKKPREPLPTTVVWLTPLAPKELPNPPAAPAAKITLTQKNKSFEPHILVVQAGSEVEFPNHDPFFHNVFSLFEGKRFDLGLYEAGTSRTVRFDRPGISYIFCNIHPEMSAVVITLATPLYAISNGGGQLSLSGVPYGRYVLHVWSEGMGPENATPMTRDVTITQNEPSLGVVRVPEIDGKMSHKNKYGREYDDAASDGDVYSH